MRMLGNGFISHFTGSSLLLDGVSNVVAAYSLRKLLSSYSGYACKVRRSSDNAEQDIGFSNGEFDLTSFSSFVGGGTGYIVTWYDQSGNSRNSAQATTTKQPSIIPSAANSKPSISFDGADDELTVSTFAITTPFSLMLAYKMKGLTDYAGPIGFRATGTAGFQIASALPTSWTPNLIVYNGTSEVLSKAYSSAISLPASYTIDSWLSSPEYRRNGTNSSLVAGSGGYPQPQYRIGRGYSALSYANVEIADVVLFSSALAVSDHNSIGVNMATRYGLSWTTVT